RLEHRCFGIITDVLGHFKMAKGTGSFGMWLAFGNPLAVNIGHLFDQVMILQENRAIGAYRQRVFITWHANARICGRWFTSFLSVLFFLVFFFIFHINTAYI